LHPELRPNKFDNKGKQKIVSTTQQDLGSDSSDEIKITTIGIKGISSNASNSSSNESLESLNDKKMNYLFQIRVIINHNKLDTLFYSGSQVNLIYEEIVKKLNLETTPHVKPYALGLVYDNAKLQVTGQCKLKFSITTNFVDEVVLDVVPLDIFRIVLRSPYMYDRKSIFYCEEKKI